MRTFNVDSSLIRERLNMPDFEDALHDSNIQSCIESALVHIESVLHTDLNGRFTNDVFYINTSSHTTRNGLYTLRCSNGFLKDAKVSSATTFGALSANSELFYMNAEKGWIYLPETFKGHYIAIAYNSGFTSEDEMPNWLVECIVSLTVQKLSAQQISDSNPLLSGVDPILTKHWSLILNSKLRSRSGVIGVI